MEPRPRRAVQNLNTFQAMAAPDLCMLEAARRPRRDRLGELDWRRSGAPAVLDPGVLAAAADRGGNSGRTM